MFHATATYGFLTLNIGNLLEGITVGYFTKVKVCGAVQIELKYRSVDTI